ncbi:MAG: glutamate racemase [Verrucomicrobiota bacterium]
MNPAQLPVGIFDSGVGGLTVARAVHQLLPREEIVYLGDTARLPYGDKSPDTIRRYAREDLAFLRERRVKAVVVACNTATAHALDDLRAAADLPVLGVLEPGVEAAAAATRNGRIGIIGTAGTINSRAYQDALHRLNPRLQLDAVPTPLLVPLIEEDWLDHEATALILREYLAPLRELEVDTLVLGCTHYPLAKPQLAVALGPGVTLVDSAENMAQALQRELAGRGLLRDAESNQLGRVRVHVTDLSPQFERLARRFLADKVHDLRAVTLPEGGA